MRGRGLRAVPHAALAVHAGPGALGAAVCVGGTDNGFARTTSAAHRIGLRTVLVTRTFRGIFGYAGPLDTVVAFAAVAVLKALWGKYTFAALPTGVRVWTVEVTEALSEVQDSTHTTVA